MKDLRDIIEFENENTALDFKSIEYKRSSFESFIKDIIAMANANISENRYIIIGVKLEQDGERKLIGIDDFTDEATYQQLINENIEPEITLRYFPFELNLKKFGVLEISDCINPPYMLKKDYGSLRKGDSFIRKGSHQTRLTRSDLDNIISKKITQEYFNSQVNFYFSENNTKTLRIKCPSEFEFPSEKIAKKIRHLIKLRKEEIKIYGNNIKTDKYVLPTRLGTPYEKMCLESLEKNLKNVKSTYELNDIHYTFEIKSHKINFNVLNQGEKYIEDAILEVKIKKNKILIAEKIYPEPTADPLYGYSSNDINPSSSLLDNIDYPEVTENDDEYIITESIGNIRHKLPQKAFKVPFRLVVHPENIGEEIILIINIFGKNLRNPINDSLSIIVEE